jgi:hypothetical protein
MNSDLADFLHAGLFANYWYNISTRFSAWFALSDSEIIKYIKNFFKSVFQKNTVTTTIQYLWQKKEQRVQRILFVHHQNRTN